MAAERPDDPILLEARFDPRLETYFMLQALAVLLISFIGIPVMPFWLFLGRAIHKRQYEALECELTERTLNVRKGFLFRVQKNVPLDKITDLSLNEGPILRWLGLCSLTIETAGGGTGSATGQAGLVGVMDAIEFRDAVMAQRDKVVHGARGAGGPSAPTPAGTTGEHELLVEIRDGLGRIEELLRKEG